MKNPPNAFATHSTLASPSVHSPDGEPHEPSLQVTLMLPCFPSPHVVVTGVPLGTESLPLKSGAVPVLALTDGGNDETAHA